MIAEELMKKYNYGYVHSCELLGEAFVKDLLKENRELKKKLKKQQKEFMTFLEDNWKETQDIWYIKILNKFKEIIGE